jgi:DNA-binding NarL/FixJ family response regulator
MKKINILLIEDNKILLDSISSLIKKERDMNCATAINNPQIIIPLIRKQKPNIVLLNYNAPNQNSLSIVKSIHIDYPETKVIIMALTSSDTNAYEFVEAGASGFMLENISCSDMIKTIRSVYKGLKVLPTFLTNMLFSQIVRHKISDNDLSAFDKIARLTKQEKNVMELIADGLTNKDIGKNLGISTYTVKSHVHNILEKLSLNTRVQIAKLAFVQESNKQT